MFGSGGGGTRASIGGGVSGDGRLGGGGGGGGLGGLATAGIDTANQAARAMNGDFRSYHETFASSLGGDRDTGGSGGGGSGGGRD